MSTPVSLDINATRYLYKPNVETTKYFINSGGADIADQVAQNTSDINDLKDRLDIDEIVINDNTTNITTNISTNTTANTCLRGKKAHFLIL